MDMDQSAAARDKDQISFRLHCRGPNILSNNEWQVNIAQRPKAYKYTNFLQGLFAKLKGEEHHFRKCFYCATFLFDLFEAPCCVNEVFGVVSPLRLSSYPV